MENRQEKPMPKRFNLYDQININERWLDVFIIGMIALLAVVVFIAL